mgnify:CR=1 FL=1
MKDFDNYLGVPSRVIDSPVEAICFDAVGTLFQVRGSVGQIYGEWASRYGFHSGTKLPVQNKIQKAFLEVFRDQGPMVFLERQNISIQQLERQWWRELVRKTFAQVGQFPRIEEFFESIYEFFATSAAWKLEPGATETLFRLQKAGKQLAVISNFDSRLCKLLEELDIRQYFDKVIVSSLAQVSKPSPLIFHSALGAMGRHPERTVHVGDDLKEDFEGARSAGLRGILYDPKDRFREKVQGLRIKKLLDVLLIFPVGVC